MVRPWPLAVGELDQATSLRGGTALVCLSTPSEPKRIEACLLFCRHGVPSTTLNLDPLPQWISICRYVLKWNSAVPMLGYVRY